MKRKYIFFICTLISLSISSQKIQQDKSPKKAAIYSAVIPGTGQIYTKKYWKVPIIYGGLVTSAYFINDNNNQYKEYRDAALLSYETGEDQSFITDRALINAYQDGANYYYQIGVPEKAEILLRKSSLYFIESDQNYFDLRRKILLAAVSSDYETSTLYLESLINESKT